MTQLRSLTVALATAIGLALAAPVAHAQDNETLSDRAKAEQIIRDYLLAHPEVIVEALEKYQAQQEEATAARQAKVLADRREELTHAPDTPVLGNPNGDVTVVEFFDYRCPYCKTVAGSFIDLFEKDGNVRFVLKEFPVLGADSEYAAKAALAAVKQGKYRDMHLALMSFKGKLSNDDVMRIAGDVGLDVPRLVNDMQGAEIADSLARNYEIGEALGVRGTPAFIVGDELIPGAISAEEMQKRIAAARES